MYACPSILASPIAKLMFIDQMLEKNGASGRHRKIQITYLRAFSELRFMLLLLGDLIQLWEIIGKVF